MIPSDQGHSSRTILLNNWIQYQSKREDSSVKVKQKHSQKEARERAVFLHFWSISPIITVFPLTEGSFLDVRRDLSNISTQSCTNFRHLYQKQEALL